MIILKTFKVNRIELTQTFGVITKPKAKPNLRLKLLCTLSNQASSRSWLVFLSSPSISPAERGLSSAMTCDRSNLLLPPPSCGFDTKPLQFGSSLDNVIS